MAENKLFKLKLHEVSDFKRTRCSKQLSHELLKQNKMEPPFNHLCNDNFFAQVSVNGVEVAEMNEDNWKFLYEFHFPTQSSFNMGLLWMDEYLLIIRSEDCSLKVFNYDY